jgi:pilus assembly protein CpaB
MGKLRALVPIAISLIIAITGTVFLYKWIERQREPKEIVEVEKVDAAPIAVAAGNLPWGTKLKPEMIKMAPYLKESLPVGYFTNSIDLKDRVIVAPLKLNEPITEAKLAPTSVKTGGVSAVLKTGMRAIAVKGDKVIGISGFINPGNRVDVIVTVEEPKTKKIKSKIFLENIAVLATGTQIEKNEKGEPMPVDVYTLEVSPEQSEKVALAASEGRLQLALRGVTDSQDPLTNGTTIPELLAYQSWSKQQKISPKLPADSNKGTDHKRVNRNSKIKRKRWVPRGSVTVEIIKGTKIEKKKFKL